MGRCEGDRLGSASGSLSPADGAVFTSHYDDSRKVDTNGCGVYNDGEDEWADWGFVLYDNGH